MDRNWAKMTRFEKIRNIKEREKETRNTKVIVTIMPERFSPEAGPHTDIHPGQFHPPEAHIRLKPPLPAI